MSNNYTLIDELDKLDEPGVPRTAGMTMIPEEVMYKYQKFIRNSTYKTPLESGMLYTENYSINTNNTSNKNPTVNICGIYTKGYTNNMY